MHSAAPQIMFRRVTLDDSSRPKLGRPGPISSSNSDTPVRTASSRHVYGLNLGSTQG